MRIIETTQTSHRIIAKYIQAKLLRKYGCDVSLGFSAGGGLRMDHPVGVVIGSGVRIGQNCTLGAHVILGEKYIDTRSSGEYPVLGDNVTLGAKTIAIGAIQIGNDVTSAAGSIILSSVHSRTRLYGIWK